MLSLLWKYIPICINWTKSRSTRSMDTGPSLLDKANVRTNQLHLFLVLGLKLAVCIVKKHQVKIEICIVRVLGRFCNEIWIISRYSIVWKFTRLINVYSKLVNPNKCSRGRYFLYFFHYFVDTYILVFPKFILYLLLFHVWLISNSSRFVFSLSKTVPNMSQAEGEEGLSLSSGD